MNWTLKVSGDPRGWHFRQIKVSGRLNLGIRAYTRSNSYIFFCSKKFTVLLFFQNTASLSFSKRDSLQQTQTEHCPAKHTVKIRSLNRNFSKLSSAKVKFNAVHFKKIANSIIPQPGASYHIKPLVPFLTCCRYQPNYYTFEVFQDPFHTWESREVPLPQPTGSVFRHRKFFSAQKKGNTV